MTDTRWAWMEVDLDAIAHNVRTLKALTAPGTLFMAVVKAEAYGHGAAQVARAALDAGADRLGVATLDEAARLREAGVTAPIQVLAECPAAAATSVVRHRVIPTIHSREAAVALSEAAAAAGVVSSFHLKVNTGMNRLGVEAEAAADFIESLRGLPGLRMDGVFTHFATADVPGDWDYALQTQRFEAAVQLMRDRRIDPGIVHAANSPATILDARSHHDMVRCGIAMYGLHPAPSTRDRIELRPAMSVKARITQVRRVSMGEGVSYGLVWRAASPTNIATVPLGYADGVRRGLSGLLHVLVGGVVCAQVGRICMDHMMVELPRGHEARVGDEVVVVGLQGAHRLGLDEQAETLGTINYELACGYGARLERIHRA